MHGAVVHRKLRFGPFAPSIDGRALQSNDQVLPVSGRALGIVSYLADYPSELVAKQELLDRVWSAVTAGESIRIHAFRIRKTPGEAQFDDRYIVTSDATIRSSALSSLP